MTDYEKIELGGSQFYLVPVEKFEDKLVGDDEIDHTLWWQYVVTDNRRINMDLGIITNVTIAMGNILREDLESYDPGFIEQHLSRIVRACLSFVNENNTDEYWRPHVEPVTEPDLVGFYESVLKYVKFESEEACYEAVMWIAHVAASWLQTILEADGTREPEEVNVDGEEEAEEVAE